jgi:cytochrome c556
MNPTAGLIIGGVAGAALIGLTVFAIDTTNRANLTAVAAAPAVVDHSQHAPGAPGAPAGTTQTAAAAAAPATTDHAQHAAEAAPEHTEHVIEARQLLMYGNEVAMMPIERAVAGEDVSLATLKASAYSIYIGLTVAPHLFPASTKPVPSPDGSAPATAAAARIWDDFDAFYMEMTAAADLAYRASQATDVAALRALGAEMRANCDACHAKNMQVFDPRGSP